jgi:hypothetical protein
MAEDNDEFWAKVSGTEARSENDRSTSLFILLLTAEQLMSLVENPQRFTRFTNSK